MKTLPQLTNVDEYRRMTTYLRRYFQANNKQFNQLRASINKAGLIPVTAVKTRGPTSSGKPTQPKALTKQQISQIADMSDLIKDYHEKVDTTKHIYALLTHHYDQNDVIIKKLIKQVKELLVTLDQSLNDRINTLSELGAQYIPQDFKNILKRIHGLFTDKFEKNYDELVVTTAPAILPAPTKDGSPQIFFVAYFEIEKFKLRNNEQDMLIVVTYQQYPTEQMFVRTLTEYRPPQWVITHDKGVVFDTPDRAFSIILKALHLEKMLDVVSPTEIPLKSQDIKFDDPRIIDTLISRSKGTIKLVLKSGLKEPDAQELYLATFTKLKKMLQTAHPRNQDIVQGVKPYQAAYKTPKGTSEKQHWFIEFKFAERSPFGESDSDEQYKTLPFNITKELNLKKDTLVDKIQFNQGVLTIVFKTEVVNNEGQKFKVSDRDMRTEITSLEFDIKTLFDKKNASLSAVRKTAPKEVSVSQTVEGKKVSEKRFVSTMRFYKLKPGEKPVKFTRDKINEVARVFDLDDSQRGEFMQFMKKYFGAR